MNASTNGAGVTDHPSIRLRLIGESLDFAWALRLGCSTMLAAVAQEIAALVSDYRQEEVPQITDARVLEWTEDVASICVWLDDDSKVILLEALGDALKVGYWSRNRIRLTVDEIDTAQFWQDAPPLVDGAWRWLDLQGSASSQSALIGLLDDPIASASGDNRHFVYLDDGLFSGGTVRREVGAWISQEAHRGTRLLVAHLAGHCDRVQSARNDLLILAKEYGVDLRMIAASHFAEPDYESPPGIKTRSVFGMCLKPDQFTYDRSDACATYRERFGWRHRNVRLIDCDDPITCERVFRSIEHREVLTRAFLEVGCKMMMWTKNPKAAMRPLGYTNDSSFGLGAMMATFHNCPNTAPLALWWGDAAMPSWTPLSRWSPLLPRRPAP